MNNEEMRSRMESMKALLEGITTRIEALPADPSLDDVMERGGHLMSFDELFRKERDWFMESVVSKERSMEVLALMGFIEMSVREIGLKLIAMKNAIEKKNPQKEPSDHPLFGLINQLRNKGIEAHVLELGTKDECDSPDCPIHGSKNKKKDAAGDN